MGLMSSLQIHEMPLELRDTGDGWKGDGLQEGQVEAGWVKG